LLLAVVIVAVLLLFIVVVDDVGKQTNSVKGQNILPAPEGKEGTIEENSTFEDFCMIFKFICKASTDFSKKYVVVVNIRTHAWVREGGGKEIY
jgi:hypothetical protein